MTTTGRRVATQVLESLDVAVDSSLPEVEAVVVDKRQAAVVVKIDRGVLSLCQVWLFWFKSFSAFWLYRV